METVTRDVRCETCLGLGYKGRDRRGKWKIECCPRCRGTGQVERSTLVLTADDARALHRFAREHGRRWKQALRDEWMRACAGVDMVDRDGREYRSVLQRLRNHEGFGTRGLGRFRLPDGFK